MLSEAGIQSEILPLFGTPPVTESTADEWLFPKLNQVGVPISVENRHRFWLFGLFGSLYQEWQPEAMFSHVLKAAHELGKTCCFIAIGHMREGEAHWRRISDEYRDRFTFVNLGEQSLDNLDALFNSLDYGVPASPLEILGKSASAAAMQEHGLPLLVVRTGCLSELDHARYVQEGIYPVDSGLFALLKAGIARRLARSRLPEVTDGFLGSLDGRQAVGPQSL